MQCLRIYLVRVPMYVVRRTVVSSTTCVKPPNQPPQAQFFLPSPSPPTQDHVGGNVLYFLPSPLFSLFIFRGTQTHNRTPIIQTVKRHLFLDTCGMPQAKPCQDAFAFTSAQFSFSFHHYWIQTEHPTRKEIQNSPSIKSSLPIDLPNSLFTNNT